MNSMRALPIVARKSIGTCQKRFDAEQTGEGEERVGWGRKREINDESSTRTELYRLFIWHSMERAGDLGGGRK